MNSTKVLMRGNKVEVRCKIVPEAYLSEYEYNRLRYARFRGLLQCDCQKQNLVFWGNGKTTVRQMMLHRMRYTELTTLVEQIIAIWNYTKRNFFRFEQIIFHPDYVFYDGQTESYKLLYYPVCGEPCDYHVGMFLLDVINAAEMNESQRQRWITVVAQASYHENQPDWSQVLEGMLRERASYRYSSEDTEPLTGISGITDITDSFDEEPPTGFEQNNEDFDDEPPTGYERPFEDAHTGFAEEEDEEMTAYLWEERAIQPKRVDTAYLLHRQTGAKKRLTSERFVIGRSRQRADFCVENNPKVGNVHAIILRKGNRYFLMDNESKNGTFLAGRRLSSGMQAELSSGMSFQIYNEDFMFTIEESGR